MTVIRTEAYDHVQTKLERLGCKIRITLTFPDETAAEMAYADLHECSTREFTMRIKPTGK